MTLKTIGSNGHDREIISRLHRGDSHQSIAEWPYHKSPDVVHGLGVPVVKLYEIQCQQDGLNRQNPNLSEIPWTKVTKCYKLIGHLFDLYFTWVHPVHMLFSELDFKHDFRRDIETHCSASLVNVIYAIECNLLECEDLGNICYYIDTLTLRSYFIKEARATLTPSFYSYIISI